MTPQNSSSTGGMEVSAVIAAINIAMQPFSEKMDRIDDKIDALQREHRLDYDTLRRELAQAFVPRDLHDEQIKALNKEIVRLSDEQAAQQSQSINRREQFWNRVLALVGAVGGTAAALAFILQHLHYLP